MYAPNPFTLPDPETQAEFYEGIPAKRAIAFVIDCAATVAITTLVLPLTLFTAILIFGPLMAAIGFAYRVVFLTRMSATPGMWLMGCEMRAGNGHRFNLSLATQHTLGFYLSFAFSIAQIASVVLMLTSPRAQGLTDMVLNTVAINLRSAS